jgi:cyclopropane fatty-acyl-phospholipid synthase-like methyltransferase
MSTIAQRSAPRRTHPTVSMCYRLLDLGPMGGVEDFSDGIYADGDARSRKAYLRAQWLQSEYLLDEMLCGRGSRVLDIGCGNGRLLRQAGLRGARARGITISPEQGERCRRQGLDAVVANYRDLPPDWDGQFDALVANGSLEHFVSVEDAAAGRGDAIYHEFFSICRRLLAPGGRLVVSSIHFRRPGQVSPQEIQRGPYAFPRLGERSHFAMVLKQTIGGWYPSPGQLESCARGRFRLLRQLDGSDDYARTSSYWLRRMKWSLACNPKVWLGLATRLAHYPQATLDMVRCLVVDASWDWQFQGHPAPTMLLRQTWEAV